MSAVRHSAGCKRPRSAGSAFSYDVVWRLAVKKRKCQSRVGKRYVVCRIWETQRVPKRPLGVLDRAFHFVPRVRAGREAVLEPARLPAVTPSRGVEIRARSPAASAAASAASSSAAAQRLKISFLLSHQCLLSDQL